MKRILNYSSLFILATIFTLGACKKKEDPAPDTRAPRTNYLSCKIDGQAWESSPTTQLINMGDTAIPAMYAELVDDTLNIMAFRVKGTDTSLVVMNAILDSDRIGTYTLSGSFHNIVYFNSINPVAMVATLFGYTPESTLEITKFDASNKKISGKFVCTMKPKSSGTSIQVTEGEIKDLSLIIE